MTFPTGKLEIISPECAMGWAQTKGNQPTFVGARLDNEILGAAFADIKRKDLLSAELNGTLSARAFVILYHRRLQSEEIRDVVVHDLLENVQIEPSPRIVIDRDPPLRIFILGSPRSGTSELGATLASVLNLRWLGEVHAAPLFAAAADALKGDERDSHEIIRFMARQSYDNIAIDSLKRAYYSAHSSASFLDKTPGIPMIRSAKFISKCFPDAKFIYLYRNGISNVLSRLAKFNGNFESHCSDWAGAISAWMSVRSDLPSFLELRQEDMLLHPRDVASRIVQYLGTIDAAEAIENSLKRGSLERTGAGLNKQTFAAAGWTDVQISRFKTICGSAMSAVGYDL